MKPLLGLFGGTFDPVHLGHINALNDLCQQVEFAKVRWILSARPPHKNSTSASIEQRFDMLQIALADSPLFVADDSEIKRASKSYTIDTVEYFKERYPEHQLVLIIGGDSLLKLDTWHRYQELIEQVHIVVMARPGYALQIPSFLQARCLSGEQSLSSAKQASLMVFEQTDYAISSTEVRALLAKLSAFDEKGQSAQQSISEIQKKLQEMLPSGVINYIHSQQSYKIEADNALQVNAEKMTPENIKDQVLAAIDNVKGQDVRVIEIADISDFADYMIVVSGTSDTHVKALAREASDSLRKQGVKPLSEDGADVGEWVLVDFGDVVLHVMRPEVREYYDLEKLWDEDVRELVKKHREQQDTPDA